MNLEELVQEARTQTQTATSASAGPHNVIQFPAPGNSNPQGQGQGNDSTGSGQAGAGSAVAIAAPPDQAPDGVGGAAGAGAGAVPVRTRPEVEVAVAPKKTRSRQGVGEAVDLNPNPNELARVRAGGLLVGVRQPNTQDQSHGAVSLILASLFGLALVLKAWHFGASSTMDFLNDWLGWSLPVTIPLDLDQLHLRIHLDFLWLFPIGLTFYQIVHRPTLSFREIYRQLHRDPASTGLWLAFTSIGIGTTLAGLILWGHERHWLVEPRIVFAQWPLLLVLFLLALAVEYLAEPFAIKFWQELKNGFAALNSRWDAQDNRQAPPPGAGAGAGVKVNREAGSRRR